MSTLPQPPPSDPSLMFEGLPTRASRAGELSAGWRVVVIVGWVGVLLGFSVTWRTARTMGLSTWWLGASSEPNFVVVQVMPFIPGIAVVIAALQNVRRVPYIGIVCAVAVAAVAAGDLGRFTRLAVLELGLASAALLISVASIAGLRRRS